MVHAYNISTKVTAKLKTGETPWGGEGGGALGGRAPLLEPSAPRNEKRTAVENWLTRASLLAVKVMIVNCNGTVSVVPFVQCQ